MDDSRRRRDDREYCSPIAIRWRHRPDHIFRVRDREKLSVYGAGVWHTCESLYRIDRVRTMLSSLLTTALTVCVRRHGRHRSDQSLRPRSILNEIYHSNTVEPVLALKQDDNALASRSNTAPLPAGAGGGGMVPDGPATRPRVPMAVESLLGV